MQTNNDQQDAIKQLRVADNNNNPQGSLANSRAVEVPQSFSSLSLDYESQVSLEASIHNQRKLSNAIAALRRDSTSDDASIASSTVATNSATTAAPNANNEITSMLLAQLFDFTQNVVGYSINAAVDKKTPDTKGQVQDSEANVNHDDAVSSLSLKLASISSSLENSVNDSVAESLSTSQQESLLASESASLSLLADSISQSLSESASLAASQQQSESLAKEATKPDFVPEMAEYSFKDAVLKRQLSEPTGGGQLATAKQLAPVVALKNDKHTSYVELRQKVHRTIILNLPSGEIKTDFQAHTFVRRGEKDDQTGEVTWLGWDKDRYVLPAYAVPNLIGYRHYPAQIPPLVVYPNGKDSTVQVKYQLEPVNKPKKVKQFGNDQPAKVEKQPALDHEKLNEDIQEEVEKELPTSKARRSPEKEKKHLSFFALIGRTFYTMFVFTKKDTEE